MQSFCKYCVYILLLHSRLGGEGGMEVLNCCYTRCERILVTASSGRDRISPPEISAPMGAKQKTKFEGWAGAMENTIVC